MGLAYNTLKAGKYYKGDSPLGAKMFLFIESIGPGITTGNLQVTAWEVQRTKGAPAGSLPSGWTRKHYANLPGTTDSYMRREVTPSEVQAEGFPLVPSSPPSAAPSSTPATGFSRSEKDGKPPAPSGQPSKPRALRKNGTPKEAIPGNKTSAVCLYCARPNKTLVLFSGSTNWCPDCEP